MWLSKLKHDPILNLLKSNNNPIIYFVKRDLLEEVVPPINTIWSLIEPKRILRKQQPNGSWKSPSRKGQKNPAVNYELTESWKQIRFLIEKYGMNNSQSSIARACEYIFKCQTEEGDIRGMLGNQYAAYYTGALLSLLIKAGYEDDPRVEKGIQWLISVRQNDGGWLANSLMALDIPWKETIRLTSQIVHPTPYQNFDKPSSHNWTGMVIRAFAAHSIHRHSSEAKLAAKLLKKKFFQEDSHYSSYKDAGYWVKFQYPFWWNNLIAA
ncbi:MAG: prenyltransferase/squalene oxidase repeat-containing protein, partial [Candidatus Kariarchaeaceae archaeon]